MRVLVVDGSSQDRELASRYLQSAGHEVSLAGDAKAAITALEHKMPDILVLDALLSGVSAVQFIQRLRQKEHGTHTYVVLVSAKPNVNELTTAIAAGADDYMRKPLNRDELVIRVGALDRIRGWAAKVFGGPAAFDLSASTEISRLQAWQLVDRSITKDVGDLLGRSMAPQATDPESAENAMGAVMPLTLASEQTEVRLTVGIDKGSVAKLGELCLGDANAPEDALRDVLREFANTAGGAFMRAAAQEGVSLTCGLPVDLPREALAAAAAQPSAHTQFVISPRDGSVRITFELEVLAKALRRVNVQQLTEGMVLARDLHTEAGALLVPAGTRLTSSQIERMARILSSRVTFDVAEAA